MTDLRDVNIRLMLARLRPSAAYHWRGQRGDTGYRDLNECLGDWRDLNPPPSAAELLDEWGRYRAEQAAEQAARQQQRDKLDVARRDLRGDELDLAAFEGSPLLLRLAQKIIWLERELQDLREAQAISRASAAETPGQNPD